MSRLFVDRTFPPNYKSAYGRDFDRFSDTAIEWKRPSAMCWSPQFIVDGATSHDLDQGQLGNCWFLAAAAALAYRRPDLFSTVVPHEQTFSTPYYTGRFEFNFYWQGAWRPVFVDDYIPTDGQRPIYCSNVKRPDEFWPCLLEKAYAKFYGSYKALDGGRIIDALVNLTGGSPEEINLQGKSRGWPGLYEKLEFYNSHNAVMGAGINEGQARSSEFLNGLESGHAYSITGFHRVTLKGKQFNLIRLRNPWGRCEWLGAWSDQSWEMFGLSEEDKQDLLLEIQDDGEFWMDFNEFIKMFDEIAICRL